MNSVPKTIRNIVYHYDAPFFIEQASRPDGVSNYSYCIGFDDWWPSKFITCIFRVYPKGQNPMSKLREQNQKWVNAETHAINQLFRNGK